LAAENFFGGNAIDIQERAKIRGGAMLADAGFGKRRAGVIRRVIARPA
jgi:hypothetical protein